MVTIRLNIPKPLYCANCPFVTWMYKDPEGKSGVTRMCIITRMRIGTNGLDPCCPMEEESDE